MRRLVILAVIVVAAVFAWRNYGGMFTKGPEHRAVIENRSDREMVGIRLEVGGRTYRLASLPDGQDATFPFRVGGDAHFDLTWSWAQSSGETSWSGGLVSRGPMAQRHVMTVDGDGNVIYRAEGR
jgi:hypothetical protein